MKKDNNLSYEAALQELQAIAQALQQDITNVDELGAKATRAAELIQYCKNKLRDTEAIVKNALD